MKESNGRTVKFEDIEDINRRMKDFVKNDEFNMLEKRVDQSVNYCDIEDL